MCRVKLSIFVRSPSTYLLALGRGRKHDSICRPGRAPSGLPQAPRRPLSLVFYELATNAAKYGALVRLRRHVVDIGMVADRRGRADLTLGWTESGEGRPLQKCRAARASVRWSSRKWSSSIWRAQCRWTIARSGLAVEMNDSGRRACFWDVEPFYSSHRRRLHGAAMKPAHQRFRRQACVTRSNKRFSWNQSRGPKSLSFRTSMFSVVGG